MKRILIITASLLIATAGPLSAGNLELNWKKNCLSCHGKDGAGNTKAGRKAKVKDFTDSKYQAEFTDEKAFDSIKNGQEKDGKVLMKSFKDKLSDDDIKELVAFVRTFKK